MKYVKSCRKYRIAAAVVSFGLILGAFFGVPGTDWMAKIQLGPTLTAVLTGATLSAGVILAVGFVVTALVGRFYCAAVCPLGIFQDFVSWLSRRKESLKSNLRWLRYGIAAVALGLLCGGGVAVFRNLEPYSIFGSALATLVQPQSAVWLGAWIPLALVAGLAIWKRRAFCVTICPVGTLLGLAAKYAPWRISIRSKECVGCGMCEKVCPTGCLDVATQTVDNERCTRCLNCVSVCRKEAIRLGRSSSETKLIPVLETPSETKSDAALETKSETKSEMKSAPGNETNLEMKLEMKTEANHEMKHEKKSEVSRRAFLGGSAGLALLAVGAQQGMGMLCAGTQTCAEGNWILPPGADSAMKFSWKCVDCGLCSARCPTGAIQPAQSWNSLVHLNLDRGVCDPQCDLCATVCPAHALRPMNVAQKQEWQIARVKYDPQWCVAVQEQDKCAKCADICPTGAVVIQISPTGFHVPRFNPELCIGCGQCRSVCLGTPQKAIEIEPISRQQAICDSSDSFRKAIRQIRSGEAKCV
ncbi:MAG: 4Fe-4S binding protein, partial [Planctomycetia bacterium]|nr:4Fe-4S binding protein [Planctomycetia bacterium]